MRNFIIYLVLLSGLLVSKAFAQDTFEIRAKYIAKKIEAITKEEKAALKAEVEAINKKLEKQSISKEEATKEKIRLSGIRAKNIETRVSTAQEELKELVQEKVDGKIREKDSTRMFKIVWNSKKDTARISELRTTSQFVFAIGFNNVITDRNFENSDYKFSGSRFYEWGLSYNTRLAENNNLLHAKYGLSMMYNDLRPTDNRRFVVNGNQTTLEVNPVQMDDVRFRNVYLVVPLHLEFDFSGTETKNGKPLFRTHKSFRFGLGGYGGINLKSKQIIKYDLVDYKTKEVTKGDFNTSNFIYGLSTYIGYRATSLYFKYDLNPLFKNNTIKQNNISLGIRFDIN
ncbi:MAG TPA: hypothetical protein VF677_00605 [Flavobacterium sp.]|jgi:hypothetical protein